MGKQQGANEQSAAQNSGYASCPFHQTATQDVRDIGGQIHHGHA
jgi:hypothetical protein